MKNYIAITVSTFVLLFAAHSQESAIDIRIKDMENEVIRTQAHLTSTSKEINTLSKKYRNGSKSLKAKLLPELKELLNTQITLQLDVHLLTIGSIYDKLEKLDQKINNLRNNHSVFVTKKIKELNL